MNSLMMFSLVLLCLAYDVHFSNGAVYQKDGCDGHRAGEKWTTEHCERCRCWGILKPNFTITLYSDCASCGSIAYDKTACYKVDKTAEERKVPYPHCCQLKLKCRGDDGFDENNIILG